MTRPPFAAAGTFLARHFSAGDLFTLLLALYVALVAQHAGIELSLRSLHTWQVLSILYGAALVLALPYFGVFVLFEDRRLIRQHGVGRSLVQTCQSLLSRYDSGRHLWEIVRTIFVVNLALVLHYNLHPRVVQINPALFDEAFRRIDVALFFGVDPVWYLTHTKPFTSDAFCRFIDQTYVLWYPVKLITIGWFLFQPDLRELRRFASAFILMWALHIVMVVCWPSLGPVFVTPEWFEPLNLPQAQQLQQHLLEGYQRLQQDPGAPLRHFDGISGFPSMHVGLVGLFALFLWRHNRVVAGLMWAYTLLIEVGSGLTGWHYLCDGIAGVAMAVAAFALVRWIYPLRPETAPAVTASGAAR